MVEPLRAGPGVVDRLAQIDWSGACWRETTEVGQDGPAPRASEKVLQPTNQGGASSTLTNIAEMSERAFKKPASRARRTSLKILAYEEFREQRHQLRESS